LRSLSDLPPVDFDATALELPLKSADPVGAPSSDPAYDQSGPDTEHSGSDGIGAFNSGPDGIGAVNSGPDGIGALRGEPEPSNTQP
jgi:hypothetical protein